MLVVVVVVVGVSSSGSSSSSSGSSSIVNDVVYTKSLHTNQFSQTGTYAPPSLSLSET